MPPPSLSSEPPSDPLKDPEPAQDFEGEKRRQKQRHRVFEDLKRLGQLPSESGSSPELDALPASLPSSLQYTCCEQHKKKGRPKKAKPHARAPPTCPRCQVPQFSRRPCNQPWRRRHGGGGRWSRRCLRGRYRRGQRAPLVSSTLFSYLSGRGRLCSSARPCSARTRCGFEARVPKKHQKTPLRG